MTIVTKAAAWSLLPLLLTPFHTVTASNNAMNVLDTVDYAASKSRDLQTTPLPQCNPSSLLQNGNFESGPSFAPWTIYGSTSYLQLTAGYGSRGDGVGSSGVSTRYRSLVTDGIMQKVNLSCLKSGDFIAFRGRVRVLNRSDGTVTSCCTTCLNTSGCPRFYLVYTMAADASEQWQEIGRISNADQENGWYTIHGMHPLDERVKAASEIKVVLNGGYAVRDYVIDDLKLHKIPLDCSTLIENPSIDGGNGGLYDTYWNADDVSKSKLSLYSPGSDPNDPNDYAVRSWWRQNKIFGAASYVDPRCIEPGLEYTVTAKFKMIDNLGSNMTCDPTKTDLGSTQCPTVVVKGEGCDPSNPVYAIRLFNEKNTTAWNVGGYNNFTAKFATDALISSCKEVYVIFGRDVPNNREVIIDDVQITGLTAAQLLREVTVAPTASPVSTTASPTTLSPTASPSLRPVVSTVTACPNPNTSPGKDGAIEVPSGSVVMLAPTSPGQLCILTKAIVNAQDGTLSKVAPVARSFDGHPWGTAAGEFAAKLLYGQKWLQLDSNNAATYGLAAGTIGSQIFLPELDAAAGETYLLTSYKYTLNEEDTLARFLNTATFGVTSQELDGWHQPDISYNSAKAWIEEQMDPEITPVTSHRKFFRERLNPRFNTPRYIGMSGHPCDEGSRWRKYTFSVKDGYKYWYPEYVGLKDLSPTVTDGGTPTGPFLITLNGQPRTMVDEFKFDRYWKYSFQVGKEYRMCYKPEEFLGGSWWLRMDDNSCEKIRNPPIHFDTSLYTLPNPVLPLPALDDGLELIDTHKADSNGQEFILTSALHNKLGLKSICTQLPDVSAEDESPVFGKLPDGTWLMFDPRLNLHENTVESPMPDGGGNLPLLTQDYSQCTNVERNPWNEDGCILSKEPNVCSGTYTDENVIIDLNGENVATIHNLTGLYVYVVENLPLAGDSGDVSSIVSPCTPETRSRWVIKPTAGCVETSLDPATKTALSHLLENSPDQNAYVRDIIFPAVNASCSAAQTASLGAVSIVVGSHCFVRVHNEHMSVYDLSYCVEEENPCLLTPLADGSNSVKQPLDQHEDVFFDYAAQPDDFWDATVAKLTKIGRFGDSVLFRQLSNDMRLDEVAKHFGNNGAGEPSSTTAASGGTIVCGSINEVSNDPTIGDVFDVYTGMDTTFGLYAQREQAWLHIVLNGKDQLRQRVAWALAQILVVVTSHIEVGWTHSEVFLAYYDIFVRNAFGNYRDILREVTFSPMMAENLSYLRSKSANYVFEEQGMYTFADENFAREVMQLFSTGLFLLHNDGTQKRTPEGKLLSTYTNAEIMSMARVFTGFETSHSRGNYEESHLDTNRVDPSTIVATWHDPFPKSDLTGGYIGDRYPLCVDLPQKMFLRKGAVYKLLGEDPIPHSFEDSPYFVGDPTVKRFVLATDSKLKQKLCNASGGKCRFQLTVTLDSNLQCTGSECNADELRVVKVDGVWFEYVRPACVEQYFYANATKVSYTSKWGATSCANPLLPYASEACCKLHTTSSNRSSAYLFDQERVLLSTAASRCKAEGQDLCDFAGIDGLDTYKKGYHWTNKGCQIQVKVNADGLVAIVYDPQDAAYRHTNVRSDNRNFFKVYWKGGEYPKNDAEWTTGGNSCGGGACTALEEGGCLCSIDVSEEAVFKQAPQTKEQVLSKLKIGAFDPDAYDAGTYVSYPGTEISVYLVNDTLSSRTVFKLDDQFGRTHILKNSKETVHVQNAPQFSFRNAPSFMSILMTEASKRDAVHEVEAALDHLLYHDNTAPFISFRLIQRFVTSSPQPSYVDAVATAFRTGFYDGIGSGNYGDLAATMAAVLLEPDAQSVVLDVDPFHGVLREPLLRVVAVLRSMELELNADKKIISPGLWLNTIGQMSHSFGSVFSFFLPEHIPEGKPGEATLFAPEAQITDMPKVTGLINGLYSTIKYGLSPCNEGLGSGANLDTCIEGDYTNAQGKLSFERNFVPAVIDADDQAYSVVDELATLLTSGRLSEDNRELIRQAYVDKLPDQGAALRIAQQLVVTSPEFHTTNTITKSGALREQPATPQPSGAPYKAVIMLMLNGGCDSFNMLIPHTCSSHDLYAEYTEVRRQAAIQPKTSLLEINASSSNQICQKFGLHPKLTAAQQLYNDGDLLFFANAGVLTKPTDKRSYKDDTVTELFAHNWMQREIQRMDPFEVSPSTGVLGRMADYLVDHQFNVGRFNIQSRSDVVSGNNPPQPFVVASSGVAHFNSDPSITDMSTSITDLNEHTTTDSGVLADFWSETLLSSVSDSELLSSTLSEVTTTSEFSDDDMGSGFKMISNLIATRNARGVDRDFFFLNYNGWDAHKDVENNLNWAFEDLNQSIQAFSNEMKLLGIWDKVTVIEVSDFGRTLEPNSGDGTDHAWGGNYIMMGGAVKGGKVVGKYPERFTQDGAEVLERGRLIPTTSWDAIFLSIAKWVGVSQDAFGDVCPNYGNFPSSHFFTVSDLFEIA